MTTGTHDMTLNSILKVKASADSAFKARDFVSADRLYTQCLAHQTKVTSDDSVSVGRLYHNRALARFKMNQWQLCIVDCKEAVATNANYTKAWFLWANAVLNVDASRGRAVLEKNAPCTCDHTQTGDMELKGHQFNDLVTKTIGAATFENVTSVFEELADLLQKAPLELYSPEVWCCVLKWLKPKPDHFACFIQNGGIEFIRRGFIAPKELKWPMDNLTFACVCSLEMIAEACKVCPQKVPDELVQGIMLPRILQSSHKLFQFAGVLVLAAIVEHQRLLAASKVGARETQLVLSFLSSKDDLLASGAWLVLAACEKNSAFESEIYAVGKFLLGAPMQSFPAFALTTIHKLDALLVDFPVSRAANLAVDASKLIMTDACCEVNLHSSVVGGPKTIPVDGMIFRLVSQCLSYMKRSDEGLVCLQGTVDNKCVLAAVVKRLHEEEHSKLCILCLTMLLEVKSFQEEVLRCGGMRHLLKRFCTNDEHNEEWARCLMALLSSSESGEEASTCLAVNEFNSAKGIEKLAKLLSMHRRGEVHRRSLLLLVELANATFRSGEMHLVSIACESFLEKGLANEARLREWLAHDKEAFMAGEIVRFVARAWKHCEHRAYDYVPLECAKLLQETLPARKDSHFVLTEQLLLAAAALVHHIDMGMSSFSQWLVAFVSGFFEGAHDYPDQLKRTASQMLVFLNKKQNCDGGSSSSGGSTKLQEIGRTYPELQKTCLRLPQASDSHWQAWCQASDRTPVEAARHSSELAVLRIRDIESALSDDTKQRVFSAFPSSLFDSELAQTLAKGMWKLICDDLRQQNGLALQVVCRKHWEMGCRGNDGTWKGMKEDLRRQIDAGAPDFSVEENWAEVCECYSELRRALLPLIRDVHKLRDQVLADVACDESEFQNEMMQVAEETLNDTKMRMFWLMAINFLQIAMPKQDTKLPVDDTSGELLHGACAYC